MKNVNEWLFVMERSLLRHFVSTLHCHPQYNDRNKNKYEYFLVGI